MSTPTQTPTAPLNPSAATALANLERALLPLDLVRAVTRYENATARYDELIARPASTLSPREFDAVGEAQQAIAESLGILADAGRLDLIAPAETAARYRQASAHCRALVSNPQGVDFKLWLCTQDEMAMCLCQLKQAGRLDLIGGAA
ncbi:MAG TPA: hypothetical protein VIP77_02620 [Jiangellaceae bacterium]